MTGFVLAGLLFLVDYFYPTYVAFGAAYLVVIMIFQHRASATTIRLSACLATLLIVAPFALRIEELTWSQTYAARGWAIVGIWLVSLISLLSKRETAQLRLKNAELGQLFKANQDLLFRLGIDGTVLAYKVDRDTRLWGFTDDILGRRMQEILPIEVGKQFDQAIIDVQEKNVLKRIEYTITLPEGRRWYETKLMLFGNDQMICVIRDITEIKRHENELTDRNDQLRDQIQQHKALSEKSHAELQDKIIAQQQKERQLQETLTNLKHSSREQIKDQQEQNHRLQENLNEVVREQKSLKQSYVNMEQHYQNQITELSQVNGEYQNQIKELQQVEEQLNQSSRQWQDRYQDCAAQLEESHEKLREQFSANTALEEQQQDLNGQLQQIQAEKTDLQESYHQLETRHDHTVNELTEANDTFQQQLNEAATSLTRLQSEFCERETALQQNVTELNQALVELQARLVEQINQQGQLADQCHQLQQTEQALRETFLTLESDHRSLTIELTNTKLNLDVENTLRQQSDSLLDALQDQIRAMQAEFDDLNEQLAENLEWTDFLEQENHAMQKFEPKHGKLGPVVIRKNRSGPVEPPRPLDKRQRPNARGVQNLPLLHKPLRICNTRR